MTLTPDQLLDVYYFMRLARAVDDRVRKLYLQGEIVGGVYSGLGMEATSIGTSYALEPHDVLTPSHRGLGAHLVRGVPLADIMRQYLARVTAPTRGADNGLHIGDMARGIPPAISHLGPSITLAAGMALAAKTRGEPIVAMGYIGEGATSNGVFHEGVNMAAVLSLPLVVIVENNGWAYSTPPQLEGAMGDVANRAAGYGIPGVAVDGNDVRAVYAAAREAVDRARSGGGPALVECKTFRVRGHSEADDASYVPEEMRDVWSRRDPLDLLERSLLEEGVLDEAGRESTALRARDAIEAAVEQARQEPRPAGLNETWGIFAGPHSRPIRRATERVAVETRAAVATVATETP